MYKLIVTLVFVLVLAASGKADDNIRFVLRDEATNATCALLNATIVVFLENNKTNATWTLNVTDVEGSDLEVNVTGSTCNSNMNMPSGYNRTIMLINNESFSIQFEFIGNFNDQNKQWNISSITVNETEVPPGLTGYVDTNLFEPASYDYKRPYMCNSFYNLTVNTNNRDYKMIIGFSDLTVQAFEFDHTDDPGFSNINSAARCPLDTAHSYIVPIAVGAALAGLVLIVLIAYIIGRLKGRRQSSYEALS